MKDRRLASNPASGVKLPRMPRPDDRYLTHEQLDAIAKACGPYETLVLVLGYTGLRWGEAAALRVGRVDVLRGRLEITEAMTEVNGRCAGAPKTHQRRAVTVPAFLRRDLIRACKGKEAGDFVWPARRGGVLRVGNFRRAYFDAAVTAAGVGDFTPHSLRRCGIVRHCVGCNVKGAQSMLGHARPRRR